MVAITFIHVRRYVIELINMTTGFMTNIFAMTFTHVRRNAIEPTNMTRGFMLRT